MTGTFNWFGLNLRESKTDDLGRAGVIVNGVKMLNNVFAAAERIHDAGTDGLDRCAVAFCDVDQCIRAGIPITSDPFGSRYFLSTPPVADRFLIQEKSEARRRHVGVGAVAPPRQPASYSEPHPWTIR